MITKKELENRLFGNDSFTGTEQSADKVAKFNTLTTLAKSVFRNEKVKADDVNDPAHRNCSVYIDFGEVGFTHDRTLIKGIVMLLENCDDVAFSTIGGKLRLSFGVYDVWSDGKPFERPGYLTEDEQEFLDAEADALIGDMSDEEIASLLED